MNQATIEKMKEMRLNGMLRAFQNILEEDSGKMPTDELISLLVDTEYDDRYNRKLARLVKRAKFRYQASLKSLDYKISRNLDKNTMSRLSGGNWISKKQNIIVTGPTGVGKSHIACAIGHQCCLMGFKVLYFNCSKLFSHLKYTKAAGNYLNELSKIEKQDVLIIDDFGLQPIDTASRLFLIEILEDRYDKSSTIIASQLPVKEWHGLIGDSTIADAICDRIIHNSYRINLEGDSVRKIYGKKKSK